MQLIPIIDGCRQQAVRYTLKEAAKTFAEAHRQGQTWDCRVATKGQQYRIMTPKEAETLVTEIRSVLQSP